MRKRMFTKVVLYGKSSCMRFLVSFFLVCLSLFSTAQKDFTIVIPKNGGQEFLKLSLMLADAMKTSTGRAVGVTTQLQDPDMIPVYLVTIGKSAEVVLPDGLDTLGDDGYQLQCDGKRFLVAAKTGQGLRNGSNAFLERLVGVRLYAPGMTYVPDKKRISTDKFSLAEKPAFTFREVHGPAARSDEQYREWHALTLHAGIYGEGGWVHTFVRLVPPSVYFTNHPEYFSLVGGMRVPDGQLCLSNPEVLNVLIANLEDFWSVQPEAKAWSVSQNDTYKPCECLACKRLDSLYGGPSGTMIWFVNQVAAAFPGKEISTLAYQYTRHAPTNIQPADNVSVVLCTIECDRGAPVEKRDPGFVKDLADWSQITSNLLIWDYVVQFRNYIDPFPNFAVLQPNLQLFRKYGAAKMFQQASGNSWSDMIELKEYLIAKLLWNPDVNVSAITDDFLNGYYGAGAPYIRQYLELMSKSLQDSDGWLGIYGYPFDGYKTYLAPELIRQYEALWDQAEEAVTQSPGHPVTGTQSPELTQPVSGIRQPVSRVLKSRLPLLYARLDISLHEPDPSMTWFTLKSGTRSVDPKMIALLDTFVVRCARYGITALDENGTTPESYRSSIQAWLQKSLTPNLASGVRHPVMLTSPASEKYPVGGPEALVDGRYGLNDYHFNWLGFEGNDLEAVIDLGQLRPVNEVFTTFLQFNQAWIFLPTDAAFSVSKDGKNFSDPVSVPAADLPQKTGSFMQEYRAIFGGESVRYVKVRANSLKVCPPWHGGHGQPCWIFCDEIVVK
jgi:hypothetical protein